MNELFRFDNAVDHSEEVDEWFAGQPYELYALAREWFTELRQCGENTNELLHDGCPQACVDDAAFAYVNVFKNHVNVGFYLGAFLKDPESLLEGSGKRMRHIKLTPNTTINKKAVRQLIKQAYNAVRKQM